MPATGRGVDLHPYYQRGTNALPGVSFGWIKEADGASPYKKIADGRTWTADAHAALFRRLGIPSGGYVFAQPGVHGGTAFDVLWGECLRLGTTGVAPACDIEGEGWNATNAKARGREFCQRARARGVRPAIYMDLWLLQACRPDTWPEDPVIWAPRYSSLKPEDGGRYTGHYDVHQFTSSGALPGSAGLVDWSQAYTSAHLLGQAPTPTMEELMTTAEPHFLPNSQTLPEGDRDDKGFARAVFAVEVGKLSDGGNSVVVDAMWFVLVSSDFGDAAGSTEYVLWAGDDAQKFIGFADGSPPLQDAIKGNDKRGFALKKGTRIITLKYRNSGEAKAGYVFPQVSQ